MTPKLTPMETGRWEGVRIIESPPSAFAKMRVGRARLEAKAKRAEEIRQKNLEAIRRQQNRPARIDLRHMAELDERAEARRQEAASKQKYWWGRK